MVLRGLGAVVITYALWLALSIEVRTERAMDRISRVVTITASSPIRVDATIADLTITGSNRSDLRIDIERSAPSTEDLARFPAMIEAGAGPVHVSVIQADEGRDPNLKSTIAIAAPAGAVFRAVRVFEGRVRLVNVRAACDVDLRRGPIEGEALRPHSPGERDRQRGHP